MIKAFPKHRNNPKGKAPAEVCLPVHRRQMEARAIPGAWRHRCCRRGGCRCHLPRASFAVPAGEYRSLPQIVKARRPVVANYTLRRRLERLSQPDRAVSVFSFRHVLLLVGSRKRGNANRRALHGLPENRQPLEPIANNAKAVRTTGRNNAETLRERKGGKGYTSRDEMIGFTLTRSVSEETTYVPRLRFALLVSFSAARSITQHLPYIFVRKVRLVYPNSRNFRKTEFIPFA